jgi:lipoprotein-releasing system permease protein
MAEVQARLDALRDRLGAATNEELEELEARMGELIGASGFRSPEDRIILGLGIRGLSFRTEEGETVRVVGPGGKVALTMIPMGRGVDVRSVTPNTRAFTVVDDCRTDVAPVDSEIVYVPLETLQALNDMAAEYSADDPAQVARPARVSMLQLKVRDEFGRDEAALRAVAGRVRAVWERFRRERPDAAGSAAVLTWRQMQAKYIGPIQQQRTLVVIMFSIISTVSVVLIFAIFYMIVAQKTRDVGVLKSVGASSGGVAGIFLMFGAAAGLVGAVLGTAGGWLFVHYINEVQDALDAWLGFRVWSKEVFLFEKIPNEVQAGTALAIAAGAVAAGLIGALIPAAWAGRMQPVEALRYE